MKGEMVEAGGVEMDYRRYLTSDRIKSEKIANINELFSLFNVSEERMENEKCKSKVHKSPFHKNKCMHAYLLPSISLPMSFMIKIFIFELQLDSCEERKPFTDGPGQDIFCELNKANDLGKEVTCASFVLSIYLSVYNLPECSFPSATWLEVFRMLAIPDSEE
ncbi:hypothetical protein MG293_001613 [Ovis ammon polii]|uniref:Uncharacterized protein n=1 Tax=Ovis ammon polii TaxID=230172 RepID=A0AAD4YIA8_OVIAM|nr:hypothetical protein MG293_001613 [Ovis ammon polii]